MEENAPNNFNLDMFKRDAVGAHSKIEVWLAEDASYKVSGQAIVLHGYDVHKQGHSSYRVDLIRDARVSNQTFIPRYEIELTPRRPGAH